MTILSSISIVHLNVLEKELIMLKNRKKKESINNVVVDYFEQRIKEINENNV
jgi:hypothetical protein